MELRCVDDFTEFSGWTDPVFDLVECRPAFFVGDLLKGIGEVFDMVDQFLRLHVLEWLPSVVGQELILLLYRETIPVLWNLVGQVVL